MQKAPTIGVDRLKGARLFVCFVKTLLLKQRLHRFTINFQVH
jgi:hypothetical protein